MSTTERYTCQRCGRRWWTADPNPAPCSCPYSDSDVAERAERIVKSAVKMARDPAVRLWLREDAFGGWSRLAAEILRRVNESAAGANVARERVDYQVAERLFRLAADALDRRVSRRFKEARKRWRHDLP